MVATPKTSRTLSANAVSLGGDADTLACIAGGIAHAYFQKIPRALSDSALAAVPEPLRGVWDEFRDRYRVPGNDATA